MRPISKKNGITLIELIMAILIIGTLAVISIPIYYNLQNRADKAAREGIKEALNSALMIYIATHNGNGPSCEQLISEVQLSGNYKLTCSKTYPPPGEQVEIKREPES